MLDKRTVKSDAAAEFDAALQAAIASATDRRTRPILQMMARCFDENQLSYIKRTADRLPAGARKKRVLEFSGIIAQLEAAASQAAALDLDGTACKTILGIGQSAVSMMFCANALDHDVIWVTGGDFTARTLLKLFPVPYFEQKEPGQLPDGHFDLIVCSGPVRLKNRIEWADFLQPLAEKLTETGKVFVTLDKIPVPKVGYDPQAVMPRLARLGASVSSRNGFVLFDAAAIQQLAKPANAELATDEQPQVSGLPSEVSLPEAGEAASPAEVAPAIEPPPRIRMRGGRLLRNGLVAFAGGLFLMMGLLIATWAGR